MTGGRSTPWPGLILPTVRGRIDAKHILHCLIAAPTAAVRDPTEHPMLALRASHAARQPLHVGGMQRHSSVTLQDTQCLHCMQVMQDGSICTACRTPCRHAEPQPSLNPPNQSPGQHTCYASFYAVLLHVAHVRKCDWHTAVHDAQLFRLRNVPSWRFQKCPLHCNRLPC